MRHRWLAASVVAYALCGIAEGGQQPSPDVSAGFVDKYCAACHNQQLKRGDLVLAGRDMASIAADKEVWEKVILKLRARAMPPSTVSRRPDAAEAAAFIGHLEQTLDREGTLRPNPGRAGVHRLNRVEYANAVRDLIALDIDPQELLPPDDAGHGFDNIADALTVSPLLLERYLNAAQKIARLAMGDPTQRAEATVYTLPFFLLQSDRGGDDLPFGSRGGIAVRHYFPLEGEYELQIRLQRSSSNLGGGVRGLDEVNHIDVRLDGAKLQTFTLGGGAAEQDGDLRGPDRDTELERTADLSLNLRFPARAGTHVLSVSFRRNMWEFEGVGMSRLPLTGYGYASGRKAGRDFGKIEMAVDHIDVRGPFNGRTSNEIPSRRRILTCAPAAPAEEPACAKRIIGTLARRAYRRPVTPADVDALMTLYAEGRKEGSFDTGIQWALEAILSHPNFLFRVERDPAGGKSGTPYRLNDLDLAARLSFFLWSSIPDDELLDAAARGVLHNPAVLEQQTRRMLKDPKASALIAGFFDQWLTLRNLPNMKPTLKLFPDFDEGLRQAFQRETELFLETQVREDRRITELLTADYTFANERLARHYGIPNIYGNHFRRVALPDDRRAGLLGQGSILMVTSYADRTSPVQRGKWLLMTVLGTPPPDPPDDVPPLPENTGAQQPRSVRERLEQHRNNPVCASCHAQMDPMGFALENFDAVGKWRTEDEKTPINASGILPSGRKFNGPAEFRAALMQEQDLFLTNVAAKLLTYALGRGVEASDMPVVRRMKADVAAADYRWSALVLGIVKSTPFQMRRSQ